MRIHILVIGTWGDIRPNVVLAQALQTEGYELILYSSENFREWVEKHGIRFVSLSVDVQGIMERIAYNNNPLVLMDNIQKFLSPALFQVGKEMIPHLQKGDTFIVIAGGLGLISGFVEKFDLRLILFNLQPLTPSRELGPIAAPALPKAMPMRETLNYQLGYFSQRMSFGLFGVQGNKLRKDLLGIPEQKWSQFRRMLDETPTITAVSRHVFPEMKSWKAHQRLTGYLFDDDTSWQAPQALLDFLAEDEKPVYIGFGSMNDRKAETTTDLVLEAIRRSGKRAVLLSGWAGLGAKQMPKDVFLLDYAPHQWLFPRMAAVVHHGGAGTTGAGLAAGVPSVIVPFFADQPNWATIVHELGAGTKPIPRNKLTADKLAAAIHEATSKPEIQIKSASLAQAIRAEDGKSEAVKAIKEFLT